MSFYLLYIIIYFDIYLPPLVVSIEPAIRPVFNISTYMLGYALTISCPIETCAENVTVQFLKGDTLISKGIIRAFEDTASVKNLVLIITENVTGEYACKVDTVNPIGSDTSNFKVAGALLIKLSFPIVLL